MELQVGESSGNLLNDFGSGPLPEQAYVYLFQRQRGRLNFCRRRGMLHSGQT
jgi:hypothetical protein